jgi:DNA-binding response OmpR family regulator
MQGDTLGKRAMRILMVEDDRRLASQIQKGLEEQRHTVTLAFDGREGLAAARQGQFDVVVLDVMLPGMDGFSIVKQVRADRIGTPILLLTARDSTEDVVTGLDAGADDYLTKPFSFKVLLARLRALGRRKGTEARTHIQIADLVLDDGQHSVRRAGVTVQLTPTEFSLLDLLMHNAGRVLTRSRIIEAVWGNERDVENNTLDVFIRQLRTKVEPRGARKLIQTIRGVGYSVREEDGA